MVYVSVCVSGLAPLMGTLRPMLTLYKKKRKSIIHYYHGITRGKNASKYNKQSKLEAKMYISFSFYYFPNKMHWHINYLSASMCIYMRLNVSQIIMVLRDHMSCTQIKRKRMLFVGAFSLKKQSLMLLA